MDRSKAPGLGSDTRRIDVISPQSTVQDTEVGWSSYLEEQVKNLIHKYWNGSPEALSESTRQAIADRHLEGNFYDYNLAIAADYLRARLETMKWGTTVASTQVYIYMSAKVWDLIPQLGPGPVSPYSSTQEEWMLRGIHEQGAAQSWREPISVQASRAADLLRRIFAH